MGGPLHILVVISSPHDLERLDVEHEWASIRRASPSPNDPVSWLSTAAHRSGRIERWLRQHTVHVLHFVGHGDAITSTAFVVLNACHRHHRHCAASLAEAARCVVASSLSPTARRRLHQDSARLPTGNGGRPARQGHAVGLGRDGNLCPGAGVSEHRTQRSRHRHRHPTTPPQLARRRRCNCRRRNRCRRDLEDSAGPAGGAPALLSWRRPNNLPRRSGHRAAPLVRSPIGAAAIVAAAVVRHVAPSARQDPLPHVVAISPGILPPAHSTILFTPEAHAPRSRRLQVNQSQLRAAARSRHRLRWPTGRHRHLHEHPEPGGRSRRRNVHPLDRHILPRGSRRRHLPLRTRTHQLPRAIHCLLTDNPRRQCHHSCLQTSGYLAGRPGRRREQRPSPGEGLSAGLTPGQDHPLLINATEPAHRRFVTNSLVTQSASTASRRNRSPDWSSRRADVPAISRRRGA